MSKYGTLPAEVDLGLSLTEQRLREIAQSKKGNLRNVILSTIQAGGKRIRPLLVLVSGMAGETKTDRLVEAATAVELIHMATLIHDDVLDEADNRRGLPTVRRIYSDRMALVCGDSLFAVAFQLLAGLDDIRLIELAAEASGDLSRGEMLQMKWAGKLDLGVEEYRRVIHNKTASLFSVSCRMGAVIAGCDDAVTAGLGEYGRALGVSFQIWDDVLDVTGDDSKTGKKAGQDILDGTMALPKILGLRRDASGRLSELLSSDNLDDAALAEALALIKDSGALAETEAAARDELVAARLALRSVPKGPARIMNKIADYVVERRV